MKFPALFLMILILSLSHLYAQTDKTTSTVVSAIQHERTPGSNIKALRVGEKVPDVELGEIINAKFKTARISDFKGKLVILDFWHTFCSVCIAQFPKLEELQKKLGDKVVILPVGFDAYREGSIKEFLAKKKGTKYQLTLPTAIQKPTDTILSALFPSQGFPHEVWIDKNGILIALTNHRAVTEENISRILSGKKIPLGEIKFTTDIYPCSDFLIKSDTSSGQITYGSVITGYIDSVETKLFGKQCDNSRIRLFTANQTVYTLYKRAYRNIDLNSQWNKRIISDAPIKMRYKDGIDVREKDNWEWDLFRRTNCFSFELILPNEYSLEDAYQYMILDLDRYFKIHSKIEKRKMQCLALIKISGTDRLKASLHEVNSKYSPDQLDAKLRNVSIGTLIKHLDNIITQFVIVDETGYTDKIDMDLRLTEKYDLSEIKNGLKKYGLDLIPVERELDVLVLQSKK